MTVEHLKKYQESLYSALSRDLSEFEKNFLFISTGVLAFTITFIKDIVKIEDAKYLSLLLISLISIVSSITLMMLTYLKSSSTCDELWDIVDNFLSVNRYHDDAVLLQEVHIDDIKSKVGTTINKCKKSLKNLRKGAIVSFLVGIGFLSFFVWINLNYQNTHKPEINKSSTTIMTSDSLIIKFKK